MAGIRRRLEDLARLADRELLRIFDAGTVPQPEKLAGWEFRGYNPPLFAKFAGIQKFKKGFFWKGGDRADLWGYNIPVIQDGIHAPWANKHGDTAPKRFGFYRVLPVPESGRESRHRNGLLLDYGQGDNPIYDGTGFIRDYLVQVDPDNDDLYLGKAYVAVGPLRVPTNFFILDRLRASDYSG